MSLQERMEHEEEQLIFGKGLDWVKSHGMLRKHGKQHTDSTHVLGAVERMSRLELVWETLRLALREVQRAAPNCSVRPSRGRSMKRITSGRAIGG